VSLFPSCEHACPGPVMTAEGLEEYAIEKILDERHQGHGYQYLVQWVGHRPEEDCWLPCHKLEECQALNVWLNGMVMCDSSFFPLGFDAPVCRLMLVEFYFLILLFLLTELSLIFLECEGV